MAGLVIAIPSWTTMQARTRSGRMDFLKIDIEGAEKYLLEEDESIAVLCEARCIFMELHERYSPGAEAAYDAFLEHGCAAHGGGRFEPVVKTGEYTVICMRRGTKYV